MSAADIISLRALQAIGITLSGMIGGANIGLSLCSVPPLQMAIVPPGVAASQWAHLYNIGKSVAPPTAMVAALCNGYVLYRALNSWPSLFSSAAPDAILLTASIVAQLVIIPFTLLFMEGGTNKRMAQFVTAAQRDGKLDASKVREELQTWKTLNAIRGAFPTIGAVLGFMASL